MTVFQRYHFYIFLLPELIDIGFEAPAGQMYASTKDLAQLMKLLFRPEEPYDPDKGQVANCAVSK